MAIGPTWFEPIVLRVVESFFEGSSVVGIAGIREVDGYKDDESNHGSYVGFMYGFLQFYFLIWDDTLLTYSTNEILLVVCILISVKY